jgi:hypothetical protein
MTGALPLRMICSKTLGKLPGALPLKIVIQIRKIALVSACQVNIRSLEAPPD